MWKNIGHFVASLGIGIFNVLAGRSAGTSVASQIGGGIGQLIESKVPGADLMINAAVTCLGDFHQAAADIGHDLKAGDKITVVVSDALVATYKAILPDLTTAVSAFENVIGVKPAPATPPAAS